MEYLSGLESHLMPLYEYECDACGTRFEQIRKFSDPPVEKCPACGGTVQKLMSLPAFQFKGTGWYVTDYARKGQSAENNGKSGDASERKEQSAENNSKSSDASERKGQSAENNGTSGDASEPGQRAKSSPSATSTSSSTPATASTGSSSSES